MSFRRWTVVYGAVIVAIIVLADTQHLGFLGRLYDFPYGDKLGHFLVFGLLSLMVNMAVLERRPGNAKVVLRATLVLAVLIGLEEFSQRWFPSRTSSAWDLMASYLGVATSAWIAIRIRRKSKLPHG